MKTAVLFFCGLFSIPQGRAFETNGIYRPRVVNGENVTLGERPYQDLYSLFQESFYPKTNHLPSSFKVIAGMVDLKIPYSTHEVEQIVVHEQYDNDNSYVNDIALIKVINPFRFSFRINPVILPEPKAKLKTNTSVVVSGWGRDSDSFMPNILQKATVYITDPAVCQTAVQERGLNIYPTQICANDPSTRRGDCNGDSGGPVTANGILVGIVSWSIKDPSCGSTHYPSIHTRVSEYIDWIRQRTI